MLINREELAEICPHLAGKRLDEYLPHLNAAMSLFEINTIDRIAAFIAQVAHESAEFRYMQEIASGAAYEGRRDLGNTHQGDGRRFKGRGPIQVTGRDNYEALSEAMGVDYVSNPKLLEQPEHAFKASAWFWESHGLNELADDPGEQSFRRITKRINGGYNGLQSRLDYWKKAKNVLYAREEPLDTQVAETPETPAHGASAVPGPAGAGADRAVAAVEEAPKPTTEDVFKQASAVPGLKDCCKGFAQVLFGGVKRVSGWLTSLGVGLSNGLVTPTVIALVVLALAAWFIYYTINKRKKAKAENETKNK